MSDTLHGQKNSPFLGQTVQFTPRRPEKQPFSWPRLQACPNAKQKTDEAAASPVFCSDLDLLLHICDDLFLYFLLQAFKGGVDGVCIVKRHIVCN